jgi:hypothetical protein
VFKASSSRGRCQDLKSHCEICAAPLVRLAGPVLPSSAFVFELIYRAIRTESDSVKSTDTILRRGTGYVDPDSQFTIRLRVLFTQGFRDVQDGMLAGVKLDRRGSEFPYPGSGPVSIWVIRSDRAGAGDLPNCGFRSVVVLYVNQRGTVFESCNELNGHNLSLANYDNGRIQGHKSSPFGRGARCADEDALSNVAPYVAIWEAWSVS